MINIMIRGEELRRELEREAREKGFASAEALVLAELLESFDKALVDYTPCEDERYVLDPGGGLALKEDLEDEAEGAR